jgi:hypothetical protein
VCYVDASSEAENLIIVSMQAVAKALEQAKQEGDPPEMNEVPVKTELGPFDEGLYQVILARLQAIYYAVPKMLSGSLNERAMWDAAIERFVSMAAAMRRVQCVSETDDTALPSWPELAIKEIEAMLRYCAEEVPCAE